MPGGRPAGAAHLCAKKQMPRRQVGPSLHSWVRYLRGAQQAGRMHLQPVRVDGLTATAEPRVPPLAAAHTSSRGGRFKANRAGVLFLSLCAPCKLTASGAASTQTRCAHTGTSRRGCSCRSAGAGAAGGAHRVGAMHATASVSWTGRRTPGRVASAPAGRASGGGPRRGSASPSRRGRQHPRGRACSTHVQPPWRTFFMSGQAMPV